MSRDFSKNVILTMRYAKEFARELGLSYIGTEHILLGLLRAEGSIAQEILTAHGVRFDRVARYVETIADRNCGIIDYTKSANQAIEMTDEIAFKAGVNYIATEHVLFALLTLRDCQANKVLRACGIGLVPLYNSVYEVVFQTATGSETGAKSVDNFFNDLEKKIFGTILTSDKSANQAYSGGETEADESDYAEADGYSDGAPKTKKSAEGKLGELKKFGVDMTALARQGKYDPVIGRDKEVERIIQILSRRTKNNPLLIGEPGVGKSAIVEGFAQAIVSGKVPEPLRNKTVFSLDLSGMLAGTRYRGDFEERLKQAIEAVKENGDIILFIDEIHNLVGAGSTGEGKMDAADILKPMLARGEMQTIGATTIDEYRKYIEKDAALERRFSTVQVDAPSVKDTIEILKGLRPKYEEHHKIKISQEAIKAAAEMSEKYITDRFLPDKAIDLIDEAASRAKIESFNKHTTVQRVLNEEDIAKIVSQWTGIPAEKLTKSESERLLHLEEELHKRVIGQDEAVEAVSRAIRRGRTGLKSENRPIGSFIFVGPTGVGKTELTKALAEVVFGDENALIRVDMSEFMEKHAVAKLIGAPPGYVGYDEAGQLTEKIRRKPYSVVLFDEIEKAHPDVFNLLLQILDDGRLTDNKGRVINFKNTLIVMTSNVGANRLKETKKLGFSTDENQYDDMKDGIIEELKKQFRPEFLNRIDDIICFHKLTKDECMKIIDILFDGLNKRLQANKIDAVLTENAKQRLLEEGYDDDYGARPLKRIIQREIENSISELLLKGEIKRNVKLTVDYRDGSFLFT